MAAEGRPIQVACRVLEVPESSYFDWRSRAPSPRSIRHAWLTDMITQVHAASRQRDDRELLEVACKSSS
jgi:hypothetical protein